MSWWATDTNFNEWVGKLQKYPIYKQQGEEVRRDISALFSGGIVDPETPDMRILDVGGGDGRLKLGKVIDISQGFDIRANWEKQGLTGYYEVAFCSLVLVTLTETELDFVLMQMRWYATRYIYFFEERYDPTKQCGQIISTQYGPKFTHKFEDHIARNKMKMVYKKESEVRPESWDRYLIEL